jgi:hypothetical protein
LAAAAFVTPALIEGVGVEVVFDAPDSGATRAAGGVVEGTSFAGVSPGGAASADVPEEASCAEGGTTVRRFAGSRADTSPRDAASRSVTEARAPPASSSIPGLSPCSSLGVRDALSAGGVGFSF